MNKKSVLCVMLALGLVLAGTGYAYWTDTLNVTTKATTGDFDVTFVDMGAYAQYDNEATGDNWSIIDGIGDPGYVKWNFFERGTNTYNDVFGNPDKRDNYYARAKGYNSVEMDAKLEDPGTGLLPGVLPSDFPYGTGDFHGDTISIELYNMYPGYAQAFRSDIINIGSIAAKLSTVDVSLKTPGMPGFPYNDEIKDLIGVALLVEDENPTIYDKFVKLASQFDVDEKFTLGGVDFVRLSALEGADIDVKDNLILVPTLKGNSNKPYEHRADLFIGIAVDPDAEGNYTTGSTKVMAEKDDAWTQNKGVQIDIKFGWDQFNEGHDPDTTNRLELQNK